MHQVRPSSEFNPVRGPDFKLVDVAIKVEAKSKLNRTYLGNLSNPTISLDKSTWLKLLSKDVFESGRLEEAFENYETDIAVMNVTHSQFGALFASYGETGKTT